MTAKGKKNYKTSHKISVVSEAAVAYGSYPALQKFTTKDDYSLIQEARKGVNTDVFYSLADAINMPEKTLASIINLSPRTISNYREQQKHLDANYSEHLLKLINLYQFGREIFGNFEEFALWLNRPFWNSEDRPIDFISTPGGVDLVHEEIEKLALGYPRIMLVYRIVHKNYSKSLFASGLEGRWNSKGKKVLYTSESVSLAYLENMSHRRGFGFNHDFRIMVIQIPSKASFYEVKLSNLPKNWRSFRNYDMCQEIGDAWFEQNEFLYMKVPSAVVTENHNIVINTFHASYQQVKLVAVLDFHPDERLEELIKQHKE